MNTGYKPGQLLNFKNYETLFLKLESYGNLIHYGSRGYTHSAMIIDVTSQGVLVIEALDKIKESYYSSDWLDNQFNLGNVAIGTPKAEIKDIKTRCEAHLGEPYDWMDIIDLAKFWLTGKKIVRNANDNAWICSEFDATMISPENDLVDDLGLPLCMISPTDLMKSTLISWEVFNGS